MSILPQITMPTLSDRHLVELESSGLPLAAIYSLRHETASPEDAAATAGHRLPGLLFSYIDPESKSPYRWGRANSKWKNRPFHRLKPDWDAVDEMTRSRYSGESGELPKYLSPPKSGCRPYFSQLQDWGALLKRSNKPVDITEGEKKADSACWHGFPTIGLAGVTAQRDKGDRGSAPSGSAWDIQEPGESQESHWLPELDAVDWKYRKVGVVFDSDIVSKFSVQRAMSRLLGDLQKRGAAPFPVILPNELDGRKNGLDDFLARHGAEAYEFLRGQWANIQRSRHKYWKKGRAKDAPWEFSYQEPGLNSIKAAMAWAVLKEDLAYRPGIGWYRWSQSRWRYVTSDDFNALLIRFCDAQGWLEITANSLATMERQLRGRLLIREDEWNRGDRRAYSNGTFYFDQEKFQEKFERQDYQTIALDYPWQEWRGDLPTVAPNWSRFLKETTAGDRNLAGLIQAIFRWAICPKDRDRPFAIEQIFDLIGLPGTGKGTILEVLMGLAGSENVASFDQETLKSQEGRSQLLDKLIAVDQDAHGHWGNVGILNKVISNEPVAVRRLYQDGNSERLGVVLFRAMNAFQSSPSGSQGLDRRILPIKFDNIPKQRDPGLKDKLKEELPAIASWVWALSPAEMKRRIRWSGSIGNVAETRLERLEANNPIVRWLVDKHPHGVNDFASELYQDYRKYSEVSGSNPLSLHNFGQILTSWGAFSVQKTKTRNGWFYSIPSVEALTRAGLLPPAQETASGTVTDCDGLVTDCVTDCNPCPEPIVHDVTDFGVKRCEGLIQKGVQQPPQTPQKSVTSVTPPPSQDSKPSQPPSHTPSHTPEKIWQKEAPSSKFKPGDSVVVDEKSKSYLMPDRGFEPIWVAGKHGVIRSVNTFGDPVTCHVAIGDRLLWLDESDLKAEAPARKSR
ncbi:DUF3854 domain-containing protein [Sodalinema gerasimenkoae]|uniref:DUF3854 domain-containing protein n=1 Tax=Sodalinema gerasimenkoae TaxID=2862348 RepID=UPI00135A938D|nr:DUF3854 domain-containing protein [Sodalinema gerasimenkoae]